MKLTHKFILAAVAALTALPACSYLDVAPAKQATFEDAMKDKAHVEGWIYSCYKTVGTNASPAFRRWESSTDEFVAPKVWGSTGRMRSIAYGTVSSSDGDVFGRWRELYGTIGHVHLFLRELDRQNPAFLSEADKELYRAHAKFIKAYNYYKLLFYFGPIPIIDEYVGSDTPISVFPGRSHFDYCVDYICDLLDQAAACPYLPSGYENNETYGRANKTICAALKARVLLYAASDLWNGKFPTPNWRNEHFETPGYGNELVSSNFDIKKWERAYRACDDAIQIALANGRRLLELEDAKSMAIRDMLPATTGCWIPGIDVSTEQGEEFANRVMLMRYVVASSETDGNHELILTANDWDYAGVGGNKATDDNNTAETVISSLPRNVIARNANDYYGGWCGISPTLNAVEAFYMSDGKPLSDPGSDRWLTSAGVSKGDEPREEIIRLNVGREPRFYAWINFDGCDIGPMIVNGNPLRLNLRSNDPKTGSGYGGNGGDNVCQTGYLSNKFLAPKTRWTGNSNNVPSNLWGIIRMSELYLNMAECCAELDARGVSGHRTEALQNLNLIRKRAGIPELKESDLGGDMSLVEWVRAERRNELFMEGHRFFDLRRWAIADKYLGAGMREGLDSFVSKISNPSLEQFNRRVACDGEFKWENRLYLLPIPASDIYKNPQMVQAPGY